MTRPWLDPLPEAASLRDAVAGEIPTLTTKRLILRAPRIEDWALLEPIWRSDRARFIGGPFTAEDALFDFAHAVAGWVLRGLGCWTVTKKPNGAVLGLVGFAQEHGDPELELGWLLTEAAEGHGYAYEAAVAARACAFDTLGLATFVSNIDRENTRSVALAERLGARRDRIDAADHVYRHYAPEASP